MSGIAIGDRVRSYDFPNFNGGPPTYQDYYIEGVVVAFEYMDGCERYKIKVQTTVRGGKHVTPPQALYVFPPLNGTLVIGGGFCNGVVKLDSQGEPLKSSDTPPDKLQPPQTA